MGVWAPDCITDDGSESEPEGLDILNGLPAPSASNDLASSSTGFSKTVGIPGVLVGYFFFNCITLLPPSIPLSSLAIAFRSLSDFCCSSNSTGGNFRICAGDFPLSISGLNTRPYCAPYPGGGSLAGGRALGRASV